MITMNLGGEKTQEKEWYRKKKEKEKKDFRSDE